MFTIIKAVLIITVLSASTTYSQITTQVLTVSVTPTVTTSAISLKVYNANLSPGGFEYLRIVNMQGVVVDDATSKVTPTMQGLQEFELPVNSYPSGVYLVVYASGKEIITEKFIKLNQ